MVKTVDAPLIESIKNKNQLNIKDNRFAQVMNLYNTAMKEVEERVNSINSDYRDIYKEDLVNHVICRIKRPESIIKKMTKKNYDLTYKDLIEKINDIAGVRIVCPYKANAFEVAEIIRGFEDWKILREKDYITNPKKTGYASYHMIVEIPIEVDGNKLYIKVEIQIRTMAMDFWATLEHEIKYKSKGEITDKVSKELIAYAKIINKIDNRLMKLHNQKNKKKLKLKGV